MTTPNPFEPPKAELDDSLLPKSKTGRYVLVTLVVIQLLATLRASPIYFELVRTGLAPVWPFLLCIVGSSCLYIAALMLIWRQRGKRLFLVAAIALGASVPMWGWLNPWALVAAFGAGLGLAGWLSTPKRMKRVAVPVTKEH